MTTIDFNFIVTKDSNLHVNFVHFWVNGIPALDLHKRVCYDTKELHSVIEKDWTALNAIWSVVKGCYCTSRDIADTSTRAYARLHIHPDFRLSDSHVTFSPPTMEAVCPSGQRTVLLVNKSLKEDAV